MSATGTNPKVLVVDDDAVFTAAMREWLVRAGFSVHVAQVGQAALQLYDLYRPYVAVVLDLHMPKVNGFRVLRHVKRCDHAARVMVVTGDPTTRGRALALGADRFFLKPIRQRTICTVLSAWVRSERPALGVAG